MLFFVIYFILYSGKGTEKSIKNGKKFQIKICYLLIVRQKKMANLNLLLCMSSYCLLFYIMFSLLSSISTLFAFHLGHNSLIPSMNWRFSSKTVSPCVQAIYSERTKKFSSFFSLQFLYIFQHFACHKYYNFMYNDFFIADSKSIKKYNK